jgi:hypothetical protein
MGVATNRKQNHWLSWSPADNGLIVIIDISFKTARPIKKKKNSGCPKKKKKKKKNIEVSLFYVLTSASFHIHPANYHSFTKSNRKYRSKAASFSKSIILIIKEKEK